MTLEWAALPQHMVDVLIGMNGVSTIVFDDLDGEIVEEEIVRNQLSAENDSRNVKREKIPVGLLLDLI